MDLFVVMLFLMVLVEKYQNCTMSEDLYMEIGSCITCNVTNCEIDKGCCRFYWEVNSDRQHNKVL